jgi:hypothetical protein
VSFAVLTESKFNGLEGVGANMSSAFKINCLDCLKRNECTSLCERARKFVDQDQVTLKEKVLGRPLLYSTWGVWDRYEVSSGVVLNDRQLCLLVLVSSGVPNKIIKHGMKMSQESMDNALRAIKKAYQKKNTEN